MGDTRDRILLTFFGSGYFPVAPGTAGSLAALLLGAAIYNALPPEYQPFLFPVLAVLAMAGCVLPGERIEDLFGRKDPGAVVIDEAAGQYKALSVVPCLPPGSSHWVAECLLCLRCYLTPPLGIRRLALRSAG